jgi:hypothetical protein
MKRLAMAAREEVAIVEDLVDLIVAVVLVLVAAVAVKAILGTTGCP